MANAALYEESAVSANEASERRRYTVFHVIGIIFFVITGVLLFFSLSYVPSMIWADELTTFERAFTIVTWVLGIVLVAAVGVICFLIKRRFNVSYDYTYVEDELRITKVFNGKSRKLLLIIKIDQLLKIGFYESESYSRTLAGQRGKKAVFLTPNKHPCEEKEFIYLLYSSTIEKTLYVLECRRVMLEFLVRAAGRNKFEAK